jgi:hypothetical protein
MTTIEGMLKEVFSVGLYNEDTSRAAVTCQQFSWVKWDAIAGWWMRGFSCLFSAGSQPVMRRLGGWCNGRQPGAELVELPVYKSFTIMRLWQEDLSAGSWRISLCRSRCQETVNGDCNRLRTLVCVCQWTLNVVPSCEYNWSINPISNPYPVYSHAP